MSLNLFNKFENRLLKEMRDFESDFFNKDSSVLNTNPHYNHSTTDTNHYYEFDLPGLKKEEINVNINNDDNYLTISGERKNKHEKNGKYHVKQVSYGSFSKSLSIPKDADKESVKAGFRDGVLTISFNKKINNTPKSVKIDVN